MPDCEVAAMLDCEDGDKEVNSNCKHCQASGETQQPQSYWNISLDLDLLQTIVNFYPEWFKDCNMNAVADGRESVDNSMCIPLSSTDLKGSVRLQNGESRTRILDKNKDSKSPPAFHEQREKLVKARIGSILKHKRHDRQDQIQQLLGDSVSNSQERQKSLKRSSFSDTSNVRLSQKSSTLELVKENIFSDELLAKAFPENALVFKSPCNTPSPKMRIGLDDDSGSDGIFSPSPPYDFNEHSQGSLPSLEASELSPNPNQGSPCSGITSFSMSPPSSVSSPMSVLPSVVSPQSSHEHITEYIVHMQQQPQNCLKESTTPNKNRKKTKPKTQPKARTIKFHEYRGPPNSKNNSSTSSNNLAESPPELNFQQRQLFLELQSAFHQQNSRPQVYVNPISTVQKNAGDQLGQTNPKPASSNQTNQQVLEQQNSSQKLISNFEDLKVSDLRAELKRRNLPVSGSKPQLIERLKSHNSTPPPTGVASGTSSSQGSSTSSDNIAAISVDTLLLDNLNSIPSSASSLSLETTNDTMRELLSTLPPDSLSSAMLPMEGDHGDSLELADIAATPFTSLSNEEIVQLQQICIERLQRDLERSQKQLQECQQPITSAPQIVNAKPPNSTPSPSTKPSSINNSKNGETIAASENKAAQKQIIQQFLQQKIQRQEQELQKTQRQQANANSCRSTSTNQNSTLTALLKSGPLNANLADLDLSSVTKSVTYFPSSVPTQIKREKEDFIPDTFSTVSAMDRDSGDGFPGVIPIFVCEASTDPLTSSTTVVSPPNALSNRSSSLPSFSALCKPTPTRSNTDPQFQITRPPPDYDSATRHLNKIKQHPVTSGDDGNPRQAKKHKTSVKSQAVDDVLAVLIASGDLPPSAAEEPTTPITSLSVSGEQTTASLFQTSSTNDVFFSKAMTTTSLLPTTGTTSMDRPHSPDINLAQSVMDMTPPSSAGFGETGCTPTTSLDFGPLLDLDDMDLGLDDDNQVSSTLDPTLSISISQDIKASLDYGVNKTNSIMNCALKTNSIADRGVESDIIEWLPVAGDSSVSSSNSNFHNSSSYALTNEHESLFPNGQDTLDFLGDDIDFNASNDLFFPWGEKPDFT